MRWGGGGTSYLIYHEAEGLEGEGVSEVIFFKLTLLDYIVTYFTQGKCPKKVDSGRTNL